MKLGAEKRLLVAVLLALGLRFLPGGGAALSYVVAAVIALTGRQGIILAFAVSWFVSFVNPSLVPETSFTSIGRYVVLASALLSIMLRQRFALRLRMLTFSVVVLGCVFIAHSILISPLVDVSVLKAISWVVTMCVLLAAWAGMDEAERKRLSDWLFAGLVILLLISIPFLATGAGFLVNGTGFQGVMNHPQAFGPTMALLASWASAKLLGEKRPRWSMVGLVGISMAMVVLSEARTAGLAVVIALVVTIISIPVVSGRRVREVLPGVHSPRLWFIAALVVLGLLLMGTTLSGHLATFLTKRGDSGSNLVEIYDQSRGEKIEEMWINIQREPWLGIGFGIASDHTKMVVDRDPILGLPTGAVIEKGVMPLAVMEELGVPIFLFVMAWFAWIIRRAARSGVVQLSVLLTAIMINFGENVFFSPGGLGLLLLILITWTVASNPVGRANP